MIPINKTRARRCLSALQAYGNEYDTRTYLIDFLADARHWCEQAGESFAFLDGIAQEHYRAERARRNP